VVERSKRAVLSKNVWRRRLQALLNLVRQMSAQLYW
jgi:hypothetical protein